jgi:hypothetical protein
MTTYPSDVIPAKAGIQYAVNSRFICDVSGILGHPPSRVTTSECASAISRHLSPELCIVCCPPEIGGRREDRVLPAPAVPCAVCAMARACTRAYRYRRSIPAFPAQWLYGLLRALPGERLFCLRHPRDAFASRRLNASTATSGPHDFTVHLRRARLSRRQCPPHPTARS